MTPEQKAEAYDKVREKIALRFGSNVAEEIFSEFEVSKDERIRRIIRGWIYTRPSSFFDNGISKEEILAWLEKQGKQEEPQVYEIGDGEVITYSETEGYKVVETTLEERIKSDPIEIIPFEELKDQKNVNIS